MKIDGAQLLAFAEILRTGSFEGAARQLNVTPSAISQRVRQLEERLGQVLIRRGSPCGPTEAGKALARLAEQIALLEAETLLALGGSALAGQRHIRIPIVVNADSLASWFLSTLDELPADHGMRFDIAVEDQDHSAALLRDGSVTAAITADPKPVQGCRVETLGVMRYLAVASPAFVRRYFAAGVTAETLATAPMVIFNNKDALQERFLQSIIAEAVQPPTHYVPSSVGFVEAARRGMGWCMVPEQLAAHALAQGALVEIRPGQVLDTPLFWQCWRIDSTVLKALTGAVRRAAAKALR